MNGKIDRYFFLFKAVVFFITHVSPGDHVFWGEKIATAGITDHTTCLNGHLK